MAKKAASVRAKRVADLSEAEAKVELADLAAEIALNDRRYHEQDAPKISDAEYDALRIRNDQIEARFPKLKRTDSPGKRVGARPSAKFATVRHAVPMLSLEKAFTDEDVRAFVEQVQRFLNLPKDDPVMLTAEPRSTACRYRSATRTVSWCRG